MGSPRPVFSLTEQWGLLGGLVGLLAVLASMGGMGDTVLEGLEQWQGTAAVEAHGSCVSLDG